MAKNLYSKARLKFSRHKAQAKFRKIDFNFTFEEWYNWWLSHGVDKNQDIVWTSTYRPCMCRNNDSGPYKLSNVYFANHIDNLVDAHKNGRRRNKIYRYKWLNESYPLQEFQNKFNISKSKLRHYLEENYDKNNIAESNRLKIQYERIYSTKITYEYDGVPYETLTSLSKVLGISKAAAGQRLKKKKFGITRIVHKPNISLNEFILKNSRFPDPVLFN